ncbi:benzoate diol dehydrogenase BenD [Streptomyces sp. NPDC051018]|uniref:benzoate diol dehydrogenase BenD n=1 Tax=Streptomyces sp. NPDC051018 TaxID=3365639 RepID=UPI00378D03A1
MNRFTGKVVAVTAAAQGIGEGVARAMAAEGAHVVLADRSPLVTAVHEAITAEGGEARAFQADLESYAAARELVAYTVAEFGHVDILVNLVGGTIWRKPYEHYGEEEIEAEIRRSLFPTLWGCRAVLPHMIERGRGVIVNVSSNATRSVNRVPYAAAKGGVNAITASLAFEAAAKGVRVCATAPGGTEAPPRRIPRHPGTMTAQEEIWHQETVDQTTEGTFLKRYGTMAEQVAPILFLASDDASYITGTTLPVAGGDLG